jgi:hypothetical protein
MIMMPIAIEIAIFFPFGFLEMFKRKIVEIMAERIPINIAKITKEPMLSKSITEKFILVERNSLLFCFRFGKVLVSRLT